AGWLNFIRVVMGVTTAQLPDDAPIIPIVYNTSLAIVNTALTSIPSPDPAYPSLYAIAVYDLSADRLLNFAQDPVNAPEYRDGLKFFAFMRKQLDLLGFVPGVLQSTSDQSDASSFLNPEIMQRLTFRDLQTMKTPYGIDYMAIAGDYGES